MDAKEDIRTLKVAELRERLQELGMSSKGKKEILVARLAEALQSEVEVNSLKKKRVAGDITEPTVGKETRKRSKVSPVMGNENAGRIDEKPWSGMQTVENIYTEMLGAGKVYPSAKTVQNLEFHGLLEDVLLPYFDQGVEQSSFLTLMMLMLNEKFDQALPNAWEPVTSYAEGMFERFFKQVLCFLYEGRFSIIEATFAMKFLSNAIQSLENATVRPCVMKICSLAMWSQLPEERRQLELQNRPELAKKWRHLVRKESKIKKQHFQASIWDSIEAKFLPWLVDNVIEIFKKCGDEGCTYSLSYIKAALVFLKDTISQLPTRRFFATYLVRCNFRAKLQCCKAVLRTRETECLHAYMSSLFDSLDAAVDNLTGEVISHEQAMRFFYGYTQKIERLFFAFWEDLKETSFSSAKDLCSTDKMKKYLTKLSDDDIKKLVCDQLKLARTQDYELFGRNLLETIFKEELKVPAGRRSVGNLPIYPDEKLIIDQLLIPNVHEATHSVYPMPKLNLQFLSLPDYLERNFTLYLTETGYDVCQNLVNVIRRLSPYTDDAGKPSFSGWSKMSQEVEGFSMVEVRPSNVGWDFPALVRAEFSITTRAMPERLKTEWDQLKQHDILFLVSLKHNLPSVEESVDDMRYLKSHVRAIRGCEIHEVRDEEGNLMNCFTEEGEWVGEGKGFKRTFTVEFDPVQYHNDVLSGNIAVYPSFDIVIRRDAKENNFKSVLNSVRDALLSESIAGDILPPWLTDTLLGYGNPEDSTFLSMSDQCIHTIDYQDTFLSKEHVIDSFPDHSIEFRGTQPPFKVTFCTDESLKLACGTREKAEQYKIIVESTFSRQKESYAGAGAGTTVRFTPTQVQAISRALQPGLSLIVGPPGSGKTDVAVQILHGLYHNNSKERTLIITHSNQALNDIFQKLSLKDISIGEMLRLGYGENLLETEEEFDKSGRVNAMLRRRVELLMEIHALAESLQVQSIGEFTCETSASFWKMHVLPRWEKYLSHVKSATDAGKIVSEFPFSKYMTQKNVMIDHKDSMNSVLAAFRVISNIFDEVESLRPFEVLTSQKNRINYMLTKQAKVIAMTCTHAAIKRQEFLDLGFSFDNILMEEAAQILDIESILPLTMQQNGEDNCRLKRLIMIGDHYQLPPVVKNPLLKNYCRFEQSLFTRLIRLKTPYIQLNMQGRCRPSLASLFNWRYRNLENLPQTSMGKFADANPGFAFVCQFVNVEDFLGKGESQPMPYFYQNLGEAEYIVLLYQYMRLLGYEAKRISILTTYNGQCQLLSDVLHQKCAEHPLFGMPGSVSTVDKYQGQQNDFVLLSLVRTRHVGHLRDVRRLVVALSRARLGLYIFGRLNLFQQCQELKPVFDQIRDKPSHLALVEGEHSGMEITRSASEVPLKSLHVQDISHMASIVKNMEAEWKRQNAM